MITLTYYGKIRTYTKRAEESADLSTLGAALDYVQKAYGREAHKLMKASMITLNGARVETLKRNLPLPDSSELGIFPVCGGG